MTNNQRYVTWGIIGCGDVAEIKSGPAFQKCGQSKLLAVMRRDSEKAKDFAQRHQVPLWYDDASLLLQNNDINAIYIATPPSTHLQYALQALDAGKDVYLEKPMVLNSEEAKVLRGAVEASDSKLVVAHYRRHVPMFLKIRQLIDSKSIGAIQLIDLKYLRTHKDDSNWRLNASISGGGHFHDIAPHQIDLMCQFFGNYEAVNGWSVNQEKNDKISDTVNGIISFKNDIQFTGVWSFNVSNHAETDVCTIYGSKGLLTFSFFGNEVRLVSGETNETFKFEHPKHIQQPFIQETVHYFLGARGNPCSVDEGFEVSKIMDAFTNKIN